MINEEACLMPSVKECTHFIPWYDALFIKGQELWFGRYDTSAKADPDDHITLVTYGLTTPIFKIFKEDALCFFDKYDHRWVMRLSKYSGISWQVNTEDDEINIRMLASIAEDELKGSKGDHNDLAITNRIKNRYSTWFEERTKSRIIPGTINDAEKAYVYFDNKACFDLKKTVNEYYYGIRGQKHFPVIHQSYHQRKPPKPKFVQFNGDYTTVVWQDGSHTTVKRAEGECYDEEKAVLFAIVKHLCNDNGCEMSRYFDSFYKHSCDISNDKEKKNGSNKKANAKKDN